MSLRSIFTNSAGILFSRITGLFRDIIMASTLGASIWSDIFFVAFKLPNLFRRIFAEGSFTQAFLPSFISSRHRATFSVKIALVFGAILLLFSLAVALFPEPLTKLLAWGWDSQMVHDAALLSQITIWYLLLIFGVTFLGSLLQYKNHFATTAFATALLNISMICALLLSKELPPKAMAINLSIGVVVGGVLQLIAHLIALYSKRLHRLLIGGIKYLKSKPPTSDMEGFKRLFFPSLLGNATAQISAFIDTLLASFLVSGSISYLFYANRIYQLPYAVITIAITTAIFPAISKALKHHQQQQANHSIAKSFWLLMWLLGLAALGGYFLSEPIIWLLFERGAFGADETIKSAAILQGYMLGLIPYGVAKLFMLLLYASKQHALAARYSIYSLLSSTALSAGLMMLWEAKGIAIANSIGGLILMLLALRGVKEQIDIGAIIAPRKLLLYLCAMALFALCFWELNGYLVALIR